MRYVLSCLVCGAEFFRSKSSHRPAPKYCSRACSGTARRGSGQAKYVWRGGKREHRTVMEEVLGRPLSPEELVHHVDNNTHNNEAWNLEVTDRRAHSRHHGGAPPRVPQATVDQIRHLAATTSMGYPEIAKATGKSRSYVRQLLVGRIRRCHRPGKCPPRKD
jgi:hypothetical protein